LKKLSVITVPVTHLQQNCSLLFDADTLTGVVVDPGGDFEKIAAVVEKYKISVTAIWLTHSHFDHCGAVAECLSKWPAAPLLGHENEAEYRAQAGELATMWQLTGISACPEPSQFIAGGEALTIGAHACKVLFVPGHSPGHVAFYFAEQKVVIAGDTLFNGSIGRTDLPGGNHELLLSSLKRELLSLPDDVLVYPGHGPTTTVGQERRSNPYLS